MLQMQPALLVQWMLAALAFLFLASSTQQPWIQSCRYIRYNYMMEQEGYEMRRQQAGNFSFTCVHWNQLPANRAPKSSVH